MKNSFAHGRRKSGGRERAKLVDARRLADLVPDVERSRAAGSCAPLYSPKDRDA